MNYDIYVLHENGLLTFKRWSFIQNVQVNYFMYKNINQIDLELCLGPFTVIRLKNIPNI